MNTTRVNAGRLLAVGFVLLASVARADLFTASYLGGGTWEQDADWSTTVYPQNGRTRADENGNPIPGPNPTYNVVINNPSPCTLGIGARIQTVNVLKGATLNLGNGGYLFANTGFANAGLITLDGPSNFSGLLRAAANSKVLAGGEIFMSDSSANSVTAGAGGKILTIAAGGRIRGAGNINQYHGDDLRAYFQIVNHGLIEAMQPVNPLNIKLTDDPAFTNAMINDGTLRASGPAGLLYVSAPFGTPGNVLNQGGRIEAVGNGTVRLRIGATITGGTLATSGKGTIRGDYPDGTGGTFTDLVNTGTMVVGQNENFGLAGTFTNKGIVRLDGTGNLSTGLLMRGANVVLAGSGLYAMNGGASIAGGDFNGQTATVAPGATIRGKGEIGTYNGNFSLKLLNVVNQGLIDATGPLTIWADNAVNSKLTNDGGTLRASNGGQLELRTPGAGGQVLNTGGVVEARTESTVRVGNSVTLEGGIVTTSGTGAIRGGANAGGTLKNVTNAGLVAISPTELLGLAGTFTNNSLVRIDTTEQGDAALLARENVTLAGTGLFTMSGGYGAVIAGRDVNSNTVTIGPGVTIRGDGRFSTINSNFLYKAIKLINHGVMEATNYMTVAISSSENTDYVNGGGIVRAGSGSYFEFSGQGNVTNNNGGVLEALADSTVKLMNGATLINNAAATIKLDGGTIDAALGLDLKGGRLIGNGIFTGAIRNTGGTVAPGFSSGKITINGNYNQGANGILSMEIGGGPATTNYDRLEVNGTASIGGVLQVRLRNGFTPAASAKYTIVATQNLIEGNFKNVASGARLPTKDGAGSFVVTYRVVNNALLSRDVTLSNFKPSAQPNGTLAPSAEEDAEPETAPDVDRSNLE